MTNSVFLVLVQKTHTQLPPHEASPIQRAVWNQGENR